MFKSLRVEHALPHHLEQVVRAFGQIFLFPSNNPHKKGSLDKTEHKIEHGSCPYAGVEEPGVLACFQDVYDKPDALFLIKGLIRHPGFHRKGHKQYAAKSFITFIIVKVQPKNFSKFFLDVLYSPQMVLNPVCKLAHPDIDKSEQQSLFAAVMFVNGGEAYSCLFGDSTNRGLVKIRCRKNFQNCLLKPAFDFGF